MLEGLDLIPWHRLTHAYGSAEDVPDLLRALTKPWQKGDDDDDESPLSCLFGNIYHQGSVYEATAYAVPFLLEVVADRSTPDRIGILDLLSEIAKGYSRLVPRTEVPSASVGTEPASRELTWAANANAAVAAGLDVLLAITKEEGDVGLAALHVLAFLPAHATAVELLMHDALRNEAGPLQRAGLLLLLGLTGGRSDATLSLLASTLKGDDALQRRAAAMSAVRLNLKPLPSGAREAIIDAIHDENLDESFYGVPWGVREEIDCEELYTSLQVQDRDKVAEGCIVAIESGVSTNQTVSILLDLIFPRPAIGQGSRLTAGELSLLQRRAVQAMARAMEGGRRIFSGYFPQWRLPDTMREWRALAAGREAAAIDKTLPMLADPRDPRRAVRASDLKIGQRVLHRAFGCGTVIESKRLNPSATELKVQFDDEGLKTLLL